MRRMIIAMVLSAGMAAAADGPPAWAYAISPPAPAGAAPAAPAPADTSVKHLPGSTLEFTRAQISDGFGPADWYPGDHPKMPEVVAHGKRPDVRACSLCHYPNGKGRPENAGVAGLPTGYFIQQMNDFRSDKRKSAEPRKANTNAMIAIAKGMTEDEIKAAAEYFGSMPWTPWIKVMETNTVPKTRLNGGMFLTLEGKEKEPLGQRIIETPVDAEGTEVLRNPRSGFIAYVPTGSIKKGEALVNQGRRQDHTMRRLPWSRSERARPGSGAGGPFPELPGASDVRHAARGAARNVDRPDETRGRQADPGRHAGHRRVYGVALKNHRALRIAVRLASPVWYTNPVTLPWASRLNSIQFPSVRDTKTVSAVGTNGSFSGFAPSCKNSKSPSEEIVA